MAAPLLETKLHVPRRRRSLVVRPRLTGRLSHVWESALTLVSAPAGFGKTTLLAEWLADAVTVDRSVAWLSLDPRDNDPARFWAYLLAALDRAVPGIGADARAVLESPQPATEAVLATLLNSLDDVPGDLAVVLDDYHLAAAAGPAARPGRAARGAGRRPPVHRRRGRRVPHRGDGAQPDLR